MGREGRFSPGGTTPAATGCGKGRFSPGDITPAVAGCGMGSFTPGSITPAVAGCGKGRFSPGGTTPAAGCGKGSFAPGGITPAVAGCGKGDFAPGTPCACPPAGRRYFIENVFEVFAVHFAVEVDEGGFVSGLGKGEYACTESRRINMTNVPKKRLTQSLRKAQRYIIRRPGRLTQPSIRRSGRFPVSGSSARHRRRRTSVSSPYCPPTGRRRNRP